jgi:phenylalanyl-tRNA synthetase beta chain
VSRDVSILCDAGQAAADVAALVRAAAGPGLRSLTFADRYAGSQVPAGKVSLTLSLRFQDPGRTLTGDEVQAAVERVMATLREAGAEIRSE